MKLEISIESLVLAAICIADMISTVVFVKLGWAYESNPFMAICIKHSIYTFMAVKLASLIPFIIVCEKYRKKNPTFVIAATRAAIALYLVGYIVLTTTRNIC